MPIVLQQPTTGSDATYTTSGTKVALDVAMTGPIVIGSVSASVDDVYVNSGNIAIIEETPIASNKNNELIKLDYISSGTSTGITTGSQIGSIIKFIGVGSYVQVLSYTADNLTQVGSYV